MAKVTFKIRVLNRWRAVRGAGLCLAVVFAASGCGGGTSSTAGSEPSPTAATTAVTITVSTTPEPVTSGTFPTTTAIAPTPPAPPPAPAPPPPQAVPTGSVGATLEVARNRYTVGKVRWVYPEKLRIHQERDIQVAVSVRRSGKELEANLTATGTKGGGKLRIYSVMRADLAGIDFKITALPPAEQAVDPNEATVWTWTIEPTATGRHVLHLSLSGVLRVRDPGDPSAVDRFVNVGSYRRALVIESVSESPGQRMSDLAGRNIAWLAPDARLLRDSSPDKGRGGYGSRRR
jgi:hypothetical protein